MLLQVHHIKAGSYHVTKVPIVIVKVKVTISHDWSTCFTVIGPYSHSIIESFRRTIEPNVLQMYVRPKNTNISTTLLYIF